MKLLSAVKLSSSQVPSLISHMALFRNVQCVSLHKLSTYMSYIWEAEFWLFLCPTVNIMAQAYRVNHVQLSFFYPFVPLYVLLFNSGSKLISRWFYQTFPQFILLLWTHRRCACDFLEMFGYFSKNLHIVEL
jgi:hypothetical protein